MLLKCGVGEYSWESLGLQGYHANQSWIFIGRTDAETPILWPPHGKSWLIWKDPDAGRDWGQEEKGTTEDEMVGWHHWLNGCESQWTPGVGDGQGGLGCCDSWGRKQWDMTELLNWSDLTPWKESYDLPRQHIKKQRHHFANKVHIVKAIVFPVVVYGC